MDSGNSGSMCSSGDEEYESRAPTVVPPFLNPPTQFGSMISHPLQSHYFSSLVSQSHDHQTHTASLLHPSPAYLLHPLSQSQPSSIPNSGGASQPNCTHLIAAAGASSSSTSSSLLAADQSLGQCSTDPSLQLRSTLHHDGKNNGEVNVLAGTTTNNGVRNSKKRSRASRRAPTTVLTTDTSNFRSMVQEFTGIPAPPFSPSSSYSRRLSSFLLNPHKHNKLHPAPNPHTSSLLSSSSTPTTTAALNMVDAIPSTTNNPSAHHQLQLLPHLTALPPNTNTMHNPHPTLFPFHTPLLQPSLQDLCINHAPHFMTTTGVSLSIPTPTHDAHPISHHVTPLLPNQDGIGITVAGAGLPSSSSGGTRDGLRAFEFEGTYAHGKGKFNFTPSSSSCSFNHDKALDINSNSNIRGEAGTVDSWICSSD